ncbi:MAG: hypothetical protein PWQ94_2378, partial [Thermoanaerobacterium sp.]|nr:hypothetical protein [Thermoanaerobacterium sp.]
KLSRLWRDFPLQSRSVTALYEAYCREAYVKRVVARINSPLSGRRVFLRLKNKIIR